MQTKTEKAIHLFRNGKVFESLRIFKTFKMGFSEVERRAIQVAHESHTGSENFYRSLGIDVDEEYRIAITAINNKYPKSEQL